MLPPQTIIECLKQACTGELPPNTRSGQSFIHDPKVAGETEVKAQIKLRFHTGGGVPVTVVRSFQLTQKKSAMQFKTLDSVLQTINRVTGEKQALTYRCADIDRIVPGFMGVSKAVLESVIFVHQEDSNWPLSETTVLKKRFDDIFAATKYTKALEALRKLRTEKAAAVREMKLKLETLRTHKDNAARHAERAARSRSTVESLLVQISDLDGAIGGVSERLAEADAALGALVAAGDEVRSLRARLDVMQRGAAELKVRLKEGDIQESSEELSSWAASADGQLGELRASLASLAREITASKMEGEALSDAYKRECKRHGRLAAEAEAAASQEADRDRFMVQAASSLGLQVDGLPAVLGAAGLQPGRPLGSQVVEAFSAALARRLAEVDDALAASRQERSAAEAAATASVDGINAQISRCGEALRMKREALAAARDELESLQSSLSAGGVMTAGMLDEYREREHEAAARLEAKRAEEARMSGSLAAALAAERSALEDLARRISGLRAERDSAAAASESTMRLRLKRQDIRLKVRCAALRCAHALAGCAAVRISHKVLGAHACCQSTCIAALDWPVSSFLFIQFDSFAPPPALPLRHPPIAHRLHECRRSSS